MMTALRKKILVTGGAGFLGSHLCERLVADGANVVSLDNLLTGDKHNLKALAENQRFEFLERDVTVPLNIGVDEIYNFASPASPIQYQRDPVNTTRTNVIGALNLLELAKNSNSRILQASTSETYGDPLVHPQTEAYWGHVNPIGPRSCYDEGKRCAESLFFDYHRQYGVDIRVARIFNTYGPRMSLDDGRVVSNFVVSALQNKNIEVNGDGLQTRSFCYVDDLIDGIVRMMDCQVKPVGPINLGNPNEITIRELAGRIITLTGSRSKVVFHSLPEDDPTRRCPDISHARRELKWETTVRLDAGLIRTISYFEQILMNEEGVPS